MKLRLVPVRKRNAAEVRALVAFVNRHYRAAVKLTARAVGGGASVYFWAKDSKTREIVGVTGFVERTPALAETVKTVIAPAQRGKGLGPLLSQAIENEVKRRGYRKVMTTIYADNIPMIVIKLKQGYRFEGFHPDHERPGFDEYSMGKKLR